MRNQKATCLFDCRHRTRATLAQTRPGDGTTGEAAMPSTASNAALTGAPASEPIVIASMQSAQAPTSIADFAKSVNVQLKPELQLTQAQLQQLQIAVGDLRLLQELYHDQNSNDVLRAEVQLNSLQVVAARRLLKLIELSQ